MTGDIAPLALTMGDPAGIGPELALAAWRDRTPGVSFVIFAPPVVLAAAAKRAGLTAPIIETDPAGARAAFAKGLPVVALKNRVEDAPGRPSAANAAGLTSPYNQETYGGNHEICHLDVIADGRRSRWLARRHHVPAGRDQQGTALSAIDHGSAQRRATRR